MSVRMVALAVSVLAGISDLTDFCSINSHLDSLSGVSRTFGCGDFFRSEMNEIGNRDHQTVQIGCGA